MHLSVVLLPAGEAHRSKERQSKIINMIACPCRRALFPSTVCSELLAILLNLIDQTQGSNAKLVEQKSSLIFRHKSSQKPRMLQSHEFQNHQQPVSLNIMYQTQWQLTTVLVDSLVNSGWFIQCLFKTSGAMGAWKTSRKPLRTGVGKGRCQRHAQKPDAVQFYRRIVATLAHVSLWLKRVQSLWILLIESSKELVKLVWWSSLKQRIKQVFLQSHMPKIDLQNFTKIK